MRNYIEFTETKYINKYNYINSETKLAKMIENRLWVPKS